MKKAIVFGLMMGIAALGLSIPLSAAAADQGKAKTPPVAAGPAPATGGAQGAAKADDQSALEGAKQGTKGAKQATDQGAKQRTDQGEAGK